MIHQKSFAAVAAKFLKCIFYLEWIGYFFLISLTIFVGLTRKSFALNLPISYSEETLRQIKPTIHNLPIGTINIENGTVYFRIKGDFWNEFFIILVLTILTGLFMLVTFQLKAIFLNFAKNQTFNYFNIKKIKYIAYILISYSIFRYIVLFVLNQIMITNWYWGRMNLTNNLELSFMLYGVGLLAVAKIFKIGVTLEEEQKLTI